MNFNDGVRPFYEMGDSTRMYKTIRSLFLMLMTILLLLGIPKLAGVFANNFDYNGMDPDGAYAWISVHHIVQALIFIILIVIVKRFTAVNYGFRQGNVEVGKGYVLRFSLFFGIYVVIAYVIAILSQSLQPFAYPMTRTNIVGQMAFQLFLSGPSEELIFRAFAITTLGFITKRRFFSGMISFPNIAAALIFGLAHVQFSFVPFTAMFSPFQIVYAVVLGFFYGDCYEKSGSILYPMIMHSTSNVLMVGMGILYTWLAG